MRMRMNIAIEDFWKHLSSRSTANMEKVCMKRNCDICEYWAELVPWPDGTTRQRLNLYYNDQGRDNNE